MRLKVRVQPRAPRDEVIEQPDSIVKVKTTAAAVNWAANKACIKLLAEHFNVKRFNVRIISGLTSREKIVEIER